MGRLRELGEELMRRALRVHSPSAHMVGDCWCQAGQPTFADSFYEGFTQAQRAMNPASAAMNDNSVYVVHESRTNPTDQRRGGEDDSSDSSI